MPTYGIGRTSGPTGGGGSRQSASVKPDESGLTIGTDPATRWAAIYESGQLPIFYDNPYLALQTVFPNINLAGPRYQALRDLGADPLVLYMAMQGNRTTASGDQGANAFVNWLHDLYASLGRVGGRTFDAQEMLRNIFSARTREGSMSPLGAMLTAGDASTQMRTLFNLLRDVTNVGMNPLASRAYQAALARAGDRALYQIARGGVAADTPVFQLIRQIMPSLVA